MRGGRRLTNGTGRWIAVLSVTVLTAAFAVAAAAGDSSAQTTDGPPTRSPYRRPPAPFTIMQVTPDALNFHACSPGNHPADPELTLQIETNHANDGIMLELTALHQANGPALPAERIAVRIPETQDYVSLGETVYVTGPIPPGSWTINLAFQASTVLNDPAGTYAGTLVITFMGAP